MSFQTGLSGLGASSRSLDVIGHNIANANTTGMKSSRAEFSSMVAASLGYGAGNGPGIGVEIASIAQQFTQGSISTTGNNLDVAINGSGFFQLTQSDGTMGYTRDGSFKLDKEGYLMTNAGANLMGVPTDSTGTPTTVSLQKLQLPTAAPIGANPTASVKARFNVDASSPIVGAANPNPIPPRSTYGTSINVYDAEGVASPVQIYFQHDAANHWEMYLGIDTVAPPVTYAPIGAGITFDATGKITAPLTALWYDVAGKQVPLGDPTAVRSEAILGLDIPAGSIKSLNPNEGTGLIPQNVTIDLGHYMPDGVTLKEGATQYGTDFAVSDLSQNGYTAGELIGVNIDENGVVVGRYSNGQSISAGLVKLADFRNVQGLSPVGGNAWAETFASGQPIQGAPGVGKFGALRSGALEDSNVDLTVELVNMMTAQRAYQANAQTIKTQDQIMSTLVNLK